MVYGIDIFVIRHGLVHHLYRRIRRMGSGSCESDLLCGPEWVFGIADDVEGPPTCLECINLEMMDEQNRSIRRGR